ncbi:uridylate kinase [Methylobacterium sp. sgz302541]|uniref:amino acid kinase family protein n=1 Tax=unclassified Methylobacterium TaxID=2615210 RepID=UPI003D33842E
MSRRPLTVVKVGGSLLAAPERLRAVLRACAEGREGACILVPGGGPFADAVRNAQADLGFSDALAHRLALDAMGRMAEIFCDLEPRLRVLCDPASMGGVAAIWDPAALKTGRPDIPERWDVTSDSLALWLAAEIGAATCLLLKSVDAPQGAGTDALSRLGLVDAAFPAFAARFSGRILLRGPGAETVVTAAPGREAA